MVVTQRDTPVSLPSGTGGGVVVCGTLGCMAITWGITIPPKYKTEWEAATDEDREWAQAWAEDILRGLTGGVFGLVQDRVRPCGVGAPSGNTYDGTLPGGYGPSFLPASVIYPGGSLSGCGCGDHCGYSHKDVALPGPIDAVVSVFVDGAEVPSSAYRIRNRRWLRRIDGEGWPTRQDLDAADDAPGAFTVTYMRGLPVPAAGQVAAGILAVEALRDMAGRDCALPRGVTSSSRNGLSVTIDPRAYFEEGLTGVDAVDQWIMSVGGMDRPANVINPNRRRPTRFA